MTNCRASPFLLARAVVDVRDDELRVKLAMALRAAVLLAALHLDDEDLVAAALADDLGVDERARDVRLSERQLLAIGTAHEENLSELHGAADFTFEFFDLEDLARLDAILLSACFNDCELRARKLP